MYLLIKIRITLVIMFAVCSNLSRAVTSKKIQKAKKNVDILLVEFELCMVIVTTLQVSSLEKLGQIDRENTTKKTLPA